MKIYRFILNPVAGHGKAPELKALIKNFNTVSGIQFETVFTEYAGHATMLAAEAVADNCYAVIAVGGDGTVNEIARSLINTNTALGILPTGSGNGLARHLGYSMQPVKVLEQLSHAELKKIDTIAINEFLSVNVSGLGFDGYVAWLFNHSGKRGLSTYTTVALKAYASYPKATFQFESDAGNFNRDAHMLVVANASQFGNKARIAPGALVDDGLFECVFVHKPPFYALPGLFLRLFTGTLKDSKWVKTIQCRNCRVSINRPLHLHIDGESVESTAQLNIRIQPASLTILKVR